MSSDFVLCHRKARWRKAATFATLILTKGAVDLVVLAILVEARILPPAAAVAILLFMFGLFVAIKPVLRTLMREGPVPA